MPVTIAHGVKALVVGIIEINVGQVEGVLLAVARYFDFRLYGIEFHVAGHGIGSLVLCSHIVLLEPSASLIAFLGSGHGFNVNAKCSDFGILLNGLGADGCSVETVVGQREVGLLNDVQDIVDGSCTGSHRDGHLARSLGRFIGNCADFAAGSRDIGQRIAFAYHRGSLREFHGSHEIRAVSLEDVVGSIFRSVHLERCQDRQVFLGSAQGSFDDDVAETDLLVVVKTVEIQLQSALSFSNGCTRYIE